MSAGEQLFKIGAKDLSAGVYILAVFNMDYFSHSSFDYKLQACCSGTPLFPTQCARHTCLLTEVAQM